MNDELILTPRHRLHKAIEIFRHADGELGVFCELCDKVTVAGQPWCCVWARLMFQSHFYDRIREAA